MSTPTTQNGVYDCLTTTEMAAARVAAQLLNFCYSYLLENLFSFVSHFLLFSLMFAYLGTQAHLKKVCYEKRNVFTGKYTKYRKVTPNVIK